MSTGRPQPGVAAQLPDESHLAISVEIAAELLGISRSFAYELCGRGELPTLRLGRRVVVPRRALLSLVESVESEWEHRAGRQTA